MTYEDRISRIGLKFNDVRVISGTRRKKIRRMIFISVIRVLTIWEMLKEIRFPYIFVLHNGFRTW